MNTSDLVGQKFGRLTVVKTEKGKDTRTIVTCDCECGEKWKGKLNSLNRMLTKSCGCLLKVHREKMKNRFAADFLHNRESKKYVRRYNEPKDLASHTGF